MMIHFEKTKYRCGFGIKIENKLGVWLPFEGNEQVCLVAKLILENYDENIVNID